MTHTPSPEDVLLWVIGSPCRATASPSRSCTNFAAVAEVSGQRACAAAAVKATPSS